MYQFTTSLPYLMNRVGVRMGALFSQKIEPYGVTLPMYRVLASLAELPNQKLGDLAQMTTVELSTMSRLIGAMVAMELVTRRRPPNNERTVQINLTDKGRDLAETLMKQAEHYESVSIRDLKAAEVENLKVLLNQVYRAMDLLEAELAGAAQ